MSSYRFKKAQKAASEGKNAEAIKWCILAGRIDDALIGYHIIVNAYSAGGIEYATPEKHAELFKDKYGDRSEMLLKFLLDHSPPQYKSIFETTLAAMQNE